VRAVPQRPLFSAGEDRAGVSVPVFVIAASAIGSGRLGAGDRNFAGRVSYRMGDRRGVLSLTRNSSRS
jgi:hypothetical protein